MTASVHFATIMMMKRSMRVAMRLTLRRPRGA